MTLDNSTQLPVSPIRHVRVHGRKVQPLRFLVEGGEGQRTKTLVEPQAASSPVASSCGVVLVLCRADQQPAPTATRPPTTRPPTNTNNQTTNNQPNDHTPPRPPPTSSVHYSVVYNYCSIMYISVILKIGSLTCYPALYVPLYFTYRQHPIIYGRVCAVPSGPSGG